MKLGLVLLVKNEVESKEILTQDENKWACRVEVVKITRISKVVISSEVEKKSEA